LADDPGQIVVDALELVEGRLRCGTEQGVAVVKSRAVDTASHNVCVRPLLIIGVERDYLRGAIVWSHL